VEVESIVPPWKASFSEEFFPLISLLGKCMKKKGKEKR